MSCHDKDVISSYTATVITVSDRASAGVYRDEAGPAVAALLSESGFEVVSTNVVPDERASIERAIRGAAASGVALVVTAGGTGLSPRDVTPDVTADVCDRLVPGIGEAMRAASAKITPFAWLSRATAGTLGRTLVVNVPGSPKASVENLTAVIEPFRHGLKVLRAEGPLDCAAERLASGVRGLAEKPVVLFDFDGTLADTKPCIVRTATQVLREWGLTDEEIGDAGRLVGPPFPLAYSLVYGLSEEDAAEVTRRYREIYAGLGPERNPLFDGVREMLTELKTRGKKLAIVSSKMERFVRMALQQTGIEDLFEEVVTQTGVKDPSKAGLIAEALRRLDAGPEDAVMLGDRHYDIEGAVAMGVDSIGVYLSDTAPAGELENAGATAIATSVSQMRRYLLGE
ncbi:MAG: molybdenum cofactor synthesis domain-containing protein [Parolsenella sp.]|uniref:molybdenum cofactor synthesis domain-containing protein n=1 Tax=Parolsenella sp. TaxID=2083006 RepID=UPI002E7683B9|nr:molybdenum cofactor synthesis domain-containing protein [Parolsenella sp.]MEE1373092.1 molybdenum cofactor synthesis domain-containing protein [Parolsenella sp.]